MKLLPRFIKGGAVHYEKDFHSGEWERINKGPWNKSQVRHFVDMTQIPMKSELETKE